MILRNLYVVCLLSLLHDSTRGGCTREYPIVVMKKEKITNEL